MLHDDFGRLALTDYRPFVPIVAKAYLARPAFEAEWAPSWRALAKHVDTLYARMSSKVRIEFVDEDPYGDYEPMERDIVQNRRLKVFKGASEHAVWTPEQNWRFRAVHDYVVHKGGQHGFTLRNEMSAYNRHVKLAPPAARVALFTEIVGQTCTYFYRDKAFPPQKICRLWGFDFEQVGLWNQDEYQRNFAG